MKTTPPNAQEEMRRADEREAYLREYYDIWRCYYDGSCPSAFQRDQALAALRLKYPDAALPDPL